MISIYTKNEWQNMGDKAIKNESKRLYLKRSRNRYYNYIKKKKNDLNDGKINEEDILSIKLIQWNIKYLIAYKLERDNLSLIEWKSMMGFRSDHIGLNGHKKFGHDTILFQQNECDKVTKETINHFIFDCNQYEDISEELTNKITEIYNNNYRRSFSFCSRDDQLKFVLFPFQNEFYDKEILQSKQ